MLRRGLVGIALAASAPLSACSLLLGEGFTDPGGEASSAPDAGAGADAEAGVIDAADASDAIREASASNDGASGDGTTRPGCPAATVSFCDDFERAEPKGDWEKVDVGLGGSLAIGGAAPDRSLAAAITSPTASAIVQKTFALVPTKLHFEVTLQYTALPSAGAIYLFGTLMLPSGKDATLVYVYAAPDGIFVVQQVTDGASYERSPLPVTPQAKHRIVLDLAFNGKVSAIVDGVLAFEADAKTYLEPAPATLTLGVSSIDGAGASFDATFDDFVFTED